MFSKATLLTAVALAIFASAAPLEVNSGISIPLRKRGALTSYDGVFDLSKATRATVKTKNKYRQNLINIVHNGGYLHAGARIPLFAKAPATVISKRQKEDLADEDHDTAWAGFVTIGSNNQRFLIDFDTGSSDFWVPSSSCTSSACSKKQKYNPSESNTSKKQTGTFRLGYGDGSAVSGPIYSDSVTVAGISVSNQIFSPVTSLSASLQRDAFDGLMGLAYPSISMLRAAPFFNNAFSSGAVKSNVFAFKLASTGSSLFLGGTDSSLYSGSFEFHNVDTRTGFWQISGGSLIVGGETTSSDFETIIDSGTTLMHGPVDAVQGFYSTIPGSSVFDENAGLYQFPCSSVPTVAFNWGGKDWTVSEANFNLGMTESGSDQCVGALAGSDLGLGDNVWLLGDSFMKNVYTSFDFGNNQVGFAALA